MDYIDKRIVVGVSGGKDSTAVCLNLLEQGYSTSDFDRVFMDTGWEDERTYEYLDQLEGTIGSIHRIRLDIDVSEEIQEDVERLEKKIGFYSPMIRRILKNSFFSNRYQKWCTTDLKIKPLKKYFDALDYDYVNLVGIRKEESPRRAKMTEWEYNEYFDCWVNRPIIDWTFEDVIDIHHRFGLVPNSLYLNGSTRVGCYPCINSRKKEISLIDRKRIDIIRELEEIVNRNSGKSDWNHSFFSSKGGVVMNIDEVVEWSNTTRGGIQYELFSTDEPTCVRWGMCEHK